MTRIYINYIIPFIKQINFFDNALISLMISIRIEKKIITHWLTNFKIKIACLLCLVLRYIFLQSN